MAANNWIVIDEQVFPIDTAEDTATAYKAMAQAGIAEADTYCPFGRTGSLKRKKHEMNTEYTPPTIADLKANAELACAMYVLEVEVCGLRRDFLPDVDRRALTMTIEEAETITGLSLAAATEIMETEGSIF